LFILQWKYRYHPVDVRQVSPADVLCYLTALLVSRTLHLIEDDVRKVNRGYGFVGHKFSASCVGESHQSILLPIIQTTIRMTTEIQPNVSRSIKVFFLPTPALVHLSVEIALRRLRHLVLEHPPAATTGERSLSMTFSFHQVQS
jgi:hypothetical protein